MLAALARAACGASLVASSVVAVSSRGLAAAPGETVRACHARIRRHPVASTVATLAFFVLPRRVVDARWTDRVNDLALMVVLVALVVVAAVVVVVVAVVVV